MVVGYLLIDMVWYIKNWKNGKVHFHMCMNSVSYVDGKKYTDKDGDLERIKSHVDQCVQRHMGKIIET